MSSSELLRATVFHTPRNPFVHADALVSHTDGGLLVRDGRIVACGDFAAIRSQYRDVFVTDMRGGYLLPGLIDTHVHFPQIRVIGNLGRSLLDWLEECALPEESRMADPSHAASTARAFVHALASHGTTTALVFGSHFAAATATLFDAAAARGIRMASGLVMSDRMLRPDLHQAPEFAYRESRALIHRYHARGRLLYAVTPRFALSSSEAILEVCQTLLRENEGLRFQTHLNENREEIAEVARLFPWARDYFGVYERYGLCGPRAVMAHNVHPKDAELHRLAASGTSVSHCPASNAALGSGIFPLRRHLQAGVKCALGTDVGAGIGFGLLREALQSYLVQRLAPDPLTIGPAHLLYLATRAGAESLGLADEIGDFGPGMAADYVCLKPPDETPLATVLESAETPERILAALFTLAGPESIRDVRVDGVRVAAHGVA